MTDNWADGDSFTVEYLIRRDDVSHFSDIVTDDKGRLKSVTINVGPNSTPFMRIKYPKGAVVPNWWSDFTFGSRR